jgi:hypothetical protein
MRPSRCQALGLLVNTKSIIIIIKYRWEKEFFALMSPSPEEYLNEVVNWRPSVPHGRADISELEERADGLSPTAPGYAWERLPLWITKVSEAYQTADGPIIGVDLGSSTPMYAQYLRGVEFTRDGERAKELARDLFSDEAFRLLRGENGWMRPLAVATSRDYLGKALVESSIQETLYTLTANDLSAPDNKAAELARKLSERFSEQRYIYGHEKRGTHVEGSQGLRIMRGEARVSYFERLSNLRVPTTRALDARYRLARDNRSKEDRVLAKETQSAGEGVAERLIGWQARFIAHKMQADPRRYRPARFLSLDNLPPEEIALSGLANMPDSTKSMPLFSHAVNSVFEPREHITGNMFEPPFPSDSVTLITSIDSWPYHFQTDPEIHGENPDFQTAALETLLKWYDILAYGGKMVIFPWAIRHDSYDEAKASLDSEVLDRVRTAFSAATGQMVHGARASRSTLEGWMSVADQQTAQGTSPIFDATRGWPADEDPYDALIINKPGERSASQLARLAVAKAESRG